MNTANSEIILSVETSSMVGSVAITKGNVCLAEFSLNTEIPLSRTLFNLIDAVLYHTKLAYADISAVAVSSGPGSFTGLRTGMAAAKSIAFSLGIPMFAIPTFEIMLESLPKNLPGMIHSFIDARKSEVYTGSFQWDAESSRYKSLGADKNIAISDFVAGLEECLLVGTMFKKNEELEKALAGLPKSISISFNAPRAHYAGVLAYHKLKNGKHPTSLGAPPYYIRKSDAEIKSILN